MADDGITSAQSGSNSDSGRDSKGIQAQFHNNFAMHGSAEDPVRENDGLVDFSSRRLKTHVNSLFGARTVLDGTPILASAVYPTVIVADPKQSGWRERILLKVKNWPVLKTELHGRTPMFEPDEQLAEQRIYMPETLIQPTEKAGEFVVEIRNGNPKHQIVFAQKLGTVMICNEVATAEAAHVLAEDLAKNSKVTIGEGGIHAFIPMVQPDDSDLVEKKQRLRDQIKIDRENLTEAEEKELWRILDAHIDAFATTPEEMGFTTLVEHDIELEPGTKPIRQKNRRFPFTVQDELEKEIKKLLDLGVIRQSDSDWASPIVPVRKKDGKIRMCIDYRKVNAVSVKDVSPLAHLNELLDKAGMEG
ncbi:MAG: hypothetical protein GY799_27995, partial [Desulfobulbaceae bacterium]|nr:hypothetical protein [Desulfobulbaceae bacterium]